MKDLYAIIGISKQAIYAYRIRQEHVQETCAKAIKECSDIRKSHPRMSCRKMYIKVKDVIPVGRDIFEQIGFANGFKLKVIRNKKKTTWSTRLGVYENLLEGKTLNGPHQALQSDIFYLEVEGKAYYGITIIDVYTRKLLALHVSRTLRADQNVKALKKVATKRIIKLLVGCIFHSDHGSQYLSEALKKLLHELKMIPSMSKLPQENAYAERVQGTIKAEYLNELEIPEKNIHRVMNKILKLYNDERPHASLGMKTPSEFEEYINKLSPADRPQLTVYKWVHPLLTNLPVINKKEKSSKKEKSQHQIN
jgi:putative transposase